MSQDQSPASNRNELSKQIETARTLLLDALDAGKYSIPGLSPDQHLQGKAVHFQDRVMGKYRLGLLVVTDELTAETLEASVDSDVQNYVIVAGWVAEDVNLGKARADRIQHMQEFDHYWVVFVLEDAVMVSAGGPPSSCRLIGEVLNLQMGKPFVQRRVCAHCHTLNTYQTLQCTQCEQPLTATGRLG